MSLSRVLTLLAVLSLCGCPRRSPDSPPVGEQLEAPCPAEAPAPPRLPFEKPEHSLSEHWLSRGPAPERVLISPAQIEEHNRRMGRIVEGGWPAARWELWQVPLGRVRERLSARLDQLQRASDRRERVLASGAPPSAVLEAVRRETAALQPADEIRIALRSTPIRCFPTETGVYEKAWDLHFDVMQCAQLRFGEPVRVAGRASRYLYVWSTYSDGWVRPEDLSPAIPSEQAASYLRPASFAVVQQDRLPIWADRDRRVMLGAAPFGLRLPLLATEGAGLAVQAPSLAGLVTGWILAPLDPAAPVETGEVSAVVSKPGLHPGVSIGYPRLTRASLLERAFRLLNTPYGWGGTADKRDCSGLIMDLFAGFGVQLPRNTKHQALAGTRHLEVAGLTDAAKAQAIEAESQRGVVLLYMPGHIMLYLGRDGDQLYALHLFSGYITPCRPRGETMQRVNRTVVTSLELGRGGSRRAFIQRITRLILLDATPPSAP